MLRTLLSGIRKAVSTPRIITNMSTPPAVATEPATAAAAAAANATTAATATATTDSTNGTTTKTTGIRAPPVPIPKNGVDYRGKVVLAPMVRSGELPSRLLALKYGADLVWGPETIDRSLIGTTRRENPILQTVDFTRYPSPKNVDLSDPNVKENLIYRLHPALEGKRLIFQLGTATPERAVEAAKLVAGDVAGIDVNAGCPKPFSTSGGMGAALLKDPERLASILEALVREVGAAWQIGISVKIRLLETAAQTEALVRRLCRTGITGLTIHCRTTPMRPRERALRDQLRMIREVCHEHGVACLVNGDVEGREHAYQLMAEYGVDGAMIATAAECNPSVFRTAAEGGKAPWEEVVREYITFACRVDNRWGNTKFLLSQMIPGKSPCYMRMNQAKCYRDLVRAMEYPELEELAAQVDARLGLPPEDKAIRKAKAKAWRKETAKVEETKKEMLEVGKEAETEAEKETEQQREEVNVNGKRPPPQEDATEGPPDATKKVKIPEEGLVAGEELKPVEGAAPVPPEAAVPEYAQPVAS